jgi:excisionase family DNA binding protein
MSEEPQDTAAELEPMYSVADLQKWTRESESIWRKRISRREIRVIKFGANTRIPKSALDEYIRRRVK